MVSFKVHTNQHFGVPYTQRSFPSSQLREKVNNARIVVSPLWRGPGNIRAFALDGQPYRQGWVTTQISNSVHRFWCRDNNIDITHVQPHHNRVR